MKLLEPIQVGKMTLKNRIMFPPLTTGYEERDGSIGQKSLSFYERLAKGGASYVVIGDVAPVRTASPTPKLYSEEQIPAFKKLADTLHQYDCKVALQIFHPEYDVPGVGKMIMEAGIARQNAAKAKAEGNEEEALKQTELAQKLTKDAYAKLHHDMQHFVSEATVEQLNQIKESIASCAHKAMIAGIDAIEVHGDRLLGSLCSEVLNHRSDVYGGSFENRIRYALEVVKSIKEAAPDLTIEYKLPIITLNKDGSLGRYTKGVTIEEFEVIRKYVKETIKDICEDMLDGNISIAPYKNKDKNSCEFCEYSSVCQFDSSLKDNNYKTIVATSSNRDRVDKILAQAKITEFFDDSICGDEVTKGKPNPEVFLKSCQKLGVNVDEAIVLEDSEAGIQASYDANIKVICIPDMKYPEKQYEEKTFKILKDLTEVTAYLKSL